MLTIISWPGYYLCTSRVGADTIWQGRLSINLWSSGGGGGRLEIEKKNIKDG